MRNRQVMLTVDVRSGLLTRSDFVSWCANMHADQALALCLRDEAATSTDFVLEQVNALGRQQAFPDTAFLDVLLYSAALPLQELLAGEVLSQLHGLTDRVEDPLLHALFFLLQRRHFWEDHFDTHAGRMLDQRPFLVANDFYILAARA